MTSDELAARGAPELLPCPFCGLPPRTFQYDGATQVSCSNTHPNCAGTDVVAPIVMWNRRAAPTTLAASPEVQRMIREAEADNRALMMDALAALVSARDTIRRKWATTNPERERVIRALSEALDVEVVPAEAAALKGA